MKSNQKCVRSQIEAKKNNEVDETLHVMAEYGATTKKKNGRVIKFVYSINKVITRNGIRCFEL